MTAANAAPAIHGCGGCFIRTGPMPAARGLCELVAAWNQPPERPRSGGGELCVISPSVANAMNVPATLVSSTMPASRVAWCWA